MTVNQGAIYTTKIDGVVCPPNISETVHETRTSSTYCLDNDKTHSKKNVLSILVKTIQRIVADPGLSQSECSSTRAAVCPYHVPLGQVPKVETIHTVPSHALNSSLVYTRRFLHGVNVKCYLRYYVIGLRM